MFVNVNTFFVSFRLYNLTVFLITKVPQNMEHFNIPVITILLIIHFHTYIENVINLDQLCDINW